MTPERLSTRLNIPLEECGLESKLPIVHAVAMIQLGHTISVRGSADPNNRAMKSTADTVDLLLALHAVNPAYELFLQCTPRSGLIAIEFQRWRDRMYLSNDYGFLDKSWRIDLPTRERGFEIFERHPDDPEFRSDCWLENCRARVRDVVPLQGSIDLKSQEQFRWSPGRSPLDLPLAPLPKSWRDGLPIVRKAAAHG